MDLFKLDKYISKLNFDSKCCSNNLDKLRKNGKLSMEVLAEISAHFNYIITSTVNTV